MTRPELISVASRLRRNPNSSFAESDRARAERETHAKLIAAQDAVR